MTTPLVSILLPHLRNPSNDAALRICLDCIVANTDINYELIVESVAERRDIYGVVNRMAEKAVSEWIIPMNTDVFVSPGWIQPLYDARSFDTIVSPVMVECGAIPVSDRNLERDFGRTPDAFHRAEFDYWVRMGGEWKPDWRADAEAWYWPSLIPRRAFLALGGFNTALGGFPDPLDKDFHERWARAGCGFRRVRSFVYHLQAWSDGERLDATR
jgi:GT2 family glycosyltransferase